MKNRNEQLIHIRRYSEDGKLLPTGGATIIIRRMGSPDTYLMYTARCADRDVFCRRIGRAIATGRCNKYPIATSKEGIKQLLDHHYTKLTHKPAPWYPSILESSDDNGIQSN